MTNESEILHRLEIILEIYSIKYIIHIVVIDGRRNGCNQFIWLSVVMVGFEKRTEQNVVNLFYPQEVLTYVPK